MRKTHENRFSICWWWWKRGLSYRRMEGDGGAEFGAIRDVNFEHLHWGF